MAKGRAAKLHLLTVRQLQSAGEGDHTDGGGLLLRVRDGSASWVFRYTSTAGRRREMGLGAVRRVTAADAGQSLTSVRKLARDARDQLEAGFDPIDAREERRAAAKRAEAEQREAKQLAKVGPLTLARHARDYHERSIEPRLTSKHAAQWIASLENHVPPAQWGKPIASVTAPELLAALVQIKPHERARNIGKGERLHETVTRIRQRLEAVFEDAIFHGHCNVNPAAAIRRKLRESMPRREHGEFAALDYREAPAFMQRLRAAEGVSARCLEFAVLTAARTSEAIGAEWSEFDLEGATWTIPAEKMKAGELHVVPLSARAVEIVRGQIGFDKVLVFPSPMRDRMPMSNMALLATLDRLGMREQTTTHGLCRATFSTWAYETDAARPDVIEACLAHKETDRVKAAYNRSKFNDERRALLDAWTEHLSRQPASVTHLRAA